MAVGNLRTESDLERWSAQRRTPQIPRKVLFFDHAPTDADFPPTVADGQFVVIDSSTPALWARIGGAWKKATLS